MIADELQKVNLMIYEVNCLGKKVYKIIYKSVDTVHELVYYIGASGRCNQPTPHRTERSKAMEKMVSTEYGYTLTINEDDTLHIEVYTEDGDLLEVDGRNGILMEASDMEAWLSEEAEEMTLEDAIYGSREFLKDWGVEHEVADAIVEHLATWFARYSTDASKYICELPEEEQEAIRDKVTEALTEQGYTGDDLAEEVELAMTSKVADVEDLAR